MSPAASADRPAIKISLRNVNLRYGKFQALKNVSLDIRDRTITALIGPSGCGKSSLVRCLNRMNDLIDGVVIWGEIVLDGQNILSEEIDLLDLRKRVGMVFQRPNPFPLSVRKNVTYGPRMHGARSKAALGEIVERSLLATGLWEELKDRLDAPALSLSPEQQQRLCISRCIAVEPEVLLMDEPCSALDPSATAKIEELMLDLRERYCIVIVTHNMQQAARVSQHAAFMLLGDLIEYDATPVIFTRPRDKRTQDYVTGRYG